jgi:hypothetical protein
VARKPRCGAAPWREVSGRCPRQSCRHPTRSLCVVPYARLTVGGVARCGRPKAGCAQISTQTILAFEASPFTFDCLVDNVGRHINCALTRVSCFNLAVSCEADRELVLNQPPWNYGFSTLLDGSKLPWVDELRARGELITHKVRSTTISREIAGHGLPRSISSRSTWRVTSSRCSTGIARGDTSKVRNIVLEAEYADTLGHSRDSLCDLLRGRGYAVEAKDAAQIMIYAWRSRSIENSS